MGNKNKQNKSAVVKELEIKSGQQELSLDEKIATVESAILQNVKKLSIGLNISLFDLNVLGRELVELEQERDAQEAAAYAGQEDQDGEADE